MTPDEAMNRIEEHHFAALTNLASNLKTFLRITAQQPEVEALSLAMHSEPAVVAEVMRRAEALSAAGSEDDREFEGDAALAAYLWLLSGLRRDLAQKTAGGVREWRLFFWARKIADHLHLPEGDANGNGSEATAARTPEAMEEVEGVHRKQ